MDAATGKPRIQITVGQALLALTLLSVALAAGRGVLHAGDWVQILVLTLACCVALGAFLGTFFREALFGAFMGFVFFTLGGLGLVLWLLSVV
jgi:hypothetical protein